jgi:uncharacterized membrane protein YozB (DUF420 family)
MSTSSLPALNASLNFTTGVLLVLGLFFIKKKNIRAHKTVMAAALFTSICFLISYLYYHYHVGSVRFLKTGWIRPVYFSILISHTILAAAIVPLVLITLTKAWKNKFIEHARIARWTWPLWMYVSITGVVIYWMLYRAG